MENQRPAIIVTGSTGLPGYPLCLRLADAGYQVYGFDRVGLPEPPKEHECVRNIECDTTDSVAVRSAMQKVHQLTGGKLASVVHMAAFHDFSGEGSDLEGSDMEGSDLEGSDLYETVTISGTDRNGTDRLLNQLEDFECEQIVFTSTMLAHAPSAVGQRVEEDVPLGAEWPYPQSKIESERLSCEGHPNARSVPVRIAGVDTDVGKRPTLVQQMKRTYEKDPQGLFFPRNGEVRTSVVHLDDAVDAIFRTVPRRDEILLGWEPRHSLSTTLPKMIDRFVGRPNHRAGHLCVVGTSSLASDSELALVDLGCSDRFDGVGTIC